MPSRWSLFEVSGSRGRCVMTGSVPHSSLLVLGCTGEAVPPAGGGVQTRLVMGEEGGVVFLSCPQGVWVGLIEGRCWQRSLEVEACAGCFLERRGGVGSSGRDTVTLPGLQPVRRAHRITHKLNSQTETDSNLLVNADPFRLEPLVVHVGCLCFWSRYFGNGD